MSRAVRRTWVWAVLGCALAVAGAQEKPAPVTEWGGRPVERVGKESGVSAPMVIHSVEPELGDSARGKKVPSFMVALIVDVEGMPQNVHIVRSSGNAEWDEAEVKAVRQYRFKPAMKDGRPVVVELSIEVDIDLF